MLYDRRFGLQIIVFMYYGEIVEQGSPEKLFQNPETEKLRKYMLDGN